MFLEIYEPVWLTRLIHCGNYNGFK